MPQKCTKTFNASQNPSLTEHYFSQEQLQHFIFFPLLKSHWTHNIRHSLYTAGFVLHSPLHEVGQLLLQLIFLGLFYVVLVFQHSLKNRYMSAACGALSSSNLPHLSQSVFHYLCPKGQSYYSFWQQNAAQCLCWLLFFPAPFTGSLFALTWIIHS